MSLIPGTGPKIRVAMALYDGAKYLDAQVESLCAQTMLPVEVLISDDGSRDHGRDMIRQRAVGNGPIRWTLIDGPGQGATANFLSLIARADPDTDYLALSDQDDVWLPEKLEAAFTALDGIDAPALYGARSWDWDQQADRRQISRAVPPPHDFRHALVQNFAGGNTMVLNRSALDLVRSALVPGLPLPAVYDWFLYQFIAGAGGRIVHDPEPRLLYRQHDDNLIGANASFASRVNRFHAMMRGTYRGWNDANIATLFAVADLLTPESVDLLHRFARDRDAPVQARLRLIGETGLHRKGTANQTALWLAALFRKL